MCTREGKWGLPCLAVFITGRLWCHLCDGLESPSFVWGCVCVCECVCVFVGRIGFVDGLMCVWACVCADPKTWLACKCVDPFIDPFCYFPCCSHAEDTHIQSRELLSTFFKYLLSFANFPLLEIGMIKVSNIMDTHTRSKVFCNCLTMSLSKQPKFTVILPSFETLSRGCLNQTHSIYRVTVCSVLNHLFLWKGKF